MVVRLQIDQPCVEICQKICIEYFLVEGWDKIESDDLIQRGSYEGGYDATEETFCFSYWTQDEQEYWVHVYPDQVTDIAKGRHPAIEMRPAE